MKYIIMILMTATSASAAPTITGDMLAPGFTVPAITSVTFLGGVNITTTSSPSAGNLYFISSHTVSGSTFTIGSAYTFFSTYNYTANTLSAPGDTLFIECAFRVSAVAPGPPTPVVGISSGTTPYFTSYLSSYYDPGANDLVVMDGQFTLTQPNMWVSVARTYDLTSGNGLSSSVGASMQFPGGSEFAFANVDQKFNCLAQRASGGTIGFAWMRVWKQ
jgi:hypothetical protein